MAQAVGRHDALLRDAVHAHHGHIVKTTGDGIYAAFDDAIDGLGAVIAIQLALLDPATTAGMGLRVRCGLHTGPVQARDNDYFGSTINRTARIMNAAHGGQILVSRAIAEQLESACRRASTLKDLGSVRLKGLATTEAVFQIVHPRLYQNFPALRELEATPNNLPQQLTSFIGRERERGEIEEMLAGTRLLTLLGMGGLGKTRLSLQIGTERDGRLSGRRLVRRPADHTRRLARRERDGARARRARRTRASADADAVRAPEDAQADADPRQLRAGDRRVRGACERDPARGAGSAHSRDQPDRAARARRADVRRAAAGRCRRAMRDSRRWRSPRRCSCSSSARSFTSRASR